jgi:hypothetical protein
MRQKQSWQPMRPATLRVSEHVRELAKDNQVIADHIEASKEVWMNDRYTVIVYRHGGDDGWVKVLSVRRNDRGAVRDWRHVQKIKTEIAGANVEGIQLFPAEDRLVDSANQTWIWCFPPGVRLPLGFDSRAIGTPEEAAAMGARQRPFEEGVLSDVA